MQQVDTLEPYEDADGNRIECDETSAATRVSVRFRGSGNVLRITGRPRLGTLSIVFDCDNGVVEMAEGGGGLSVNLRVGQDSKILFGRNVTSTDTVGMSATEGTTIRLGADVMFASQNQVRADDGHPIFDIRSGKRVNVSRDITIGDHVWLGWGAWVLGGSVIGEGTVVGVGSVVKAKIPNNVVAVGVPARVVRRDIAWERPHLSLVKPFYKPDASTVKKSKYWNLTVDPSTPAAPARRVRSFAGRVKRRLKRALAR